MSDDQRLDVLINERGMTRSRSKAKARIMAGEVYVDGEQVDKAGTYISPDADIEIRGDDNPYVSRGGLKLASAMKVFDGLSFDAKTVIDVGASTGGFTDYALQHGADHVYALDVGYGQLDWNLREDDRVTVIERTNIRETEAGLLEGPADIATIDCSFISLDLVLPNTLPHLADEADVVALVKPQFEAGKENVGKGGVVRDEEIRREAIDGVIETAEQLGLETRGATDSDVHGPAGNVEHFVWWHDVRE